MIRVLIIALLLALSLPLRGTVIIYERSTGNVLDCVTNRGKVELYMRGKYIPFWYGESDSVAVLDDTTGESTSLPDSVVVYDYATELAKIGLVEILVDSTARKIVNDPSPELIFTGEQVSGVEIEGETILISPGDNIQ